MHSQLLHQLQGAKLHAQSVASSITRSQNFALPKLSFLTELMSMHNLSPGMLDGFLIDLGTLACLAFASA
jgi:hypothetical protein